MPKSKTARVTERILADLPVIDLLVEDPPIEEVIERVFAQESHEVTGRLYLQQFKTTMAMMFQYRAMLAIWMLGQVLEPLIYLIVWSAVSPEPAAAWEATPRGTSPAISCCLCWSTSPAIPG